MKELPPEIQKIYHIKELVIAISKLLAAVAGVIGVTTSLYISISNNTELKKQMEESKVRAAQIEVIQSINREEFE